MTLHKGTSAAVFRVAPGASGGGAGLVLGEGHGRTGLGVRGSSLLRKAPTLSATATNVPFPDVSPVTTCESKSCDSGPTRARSSSPWSALS